MELSQLFTVAGAIKMAEGEPAVGTVVATGLIIVFSVLILLYLLISLEGIIFRSIDNKKKGIVSTPKKEAAPVAKASAAVAKASTAPIIEKGIPGEVIAAIAAAISAMEGGNNRYTIRSLTRAKTGRSAWGVAGVSSYTEPF
ncbi:MAG: OadG family transporter subunit [Ruthenibacterium sp.]